MRNRVNFPLLFIVFLLLGIYLGGVVYAVKKDEIWGIWAQWRGKKMGPGIPRVGDLPADFTLKDLQGKEVKLSQVVKENKVVIVDFFATWCPPCRRGADHLNRLQQKYSEGDLKVLIIDIGEDPYTVKSFFSNQGYRLTVLLDETREVKKTYGVEGIPRTFFITRKGIVEDHIGMMELPELEEILQKWL
ncbi:MAG: TlpA family protein disulfide reductase [bacterium JZ-2024 1]